MKKHKYMKERIKAGLTPYMVSKELGIEYNKYKEVEKGERALEGEYINRFQNIIKNATELKMKHYSKMMEVNTWFSDKEAVHKKMKEYGYNNSMLAKKLGVSATHISNTLNNKKLKSGGDELKERIYDTLHDIMNKIIEGNKYSFDNINDKQKNVLNTDIDQKLKNTVEKSAENENNKNSKIDIKEETKQKCEEKKEIDIKDAYKKLQEINIELSKSLFEALNENVKLKRQIRMYEKLIERL